MIRMVMEIESHLIKRHVIINNTSMSNDDKCEIVSLAFDPWCHVIPPMIDLMAACMRNELKMTIMAIRLRQHYDYSYIMQLVILLHNWKSDSTNRKSGLFLEIPMATKSGGNSWEAANRNEDTRENMKRPSSQRPVHHSAVNGVSSIRVIIVV
jgi:DNA phosphorothioation-dependent restriction protein DptG